MTPLIATDIGYSTISPPELRASSGWEETEFRHPHLQPVRRAWGYIFGDEVMDTALSTGSCNNRHIVNIRGNCYGMRLRAGLFNTF